MIKKLKEIKEFDSQRIYNLSKEGINNIDSLNKLFPYFTKEEIEYIINNDKKYKEEYNSLINEINVIKLNNNFRLNTSIIIMREIFIFIKLKYFRTNKLLELFNFKFNSIYQIKNSKSYKIFKINEINLDNYRRDNYFNKPHNKSYNVLSDEEIERIRYIKKNSILTTREIAEEFSCCLDVVAKNTKDIKAKSNEEKNLIVMEIYRMIDKEYSFEEIRSKFIITRNLYEKLKNKEIYKQIIRKYYELKEIFG